MLPSRIARLGLALALIVLFIFAFSTVEAFDDYGIRIVDVNPSSAYANDVVYVCGTGATPKKAVEAWLSGPTSNEPIYIGNSTLPVIIVGIHNISLGWTLANETGQWGISFITPRTFQGDYDLVLFDNETRTSDAILFKVQTTIVMEPIRTFNIQSMTPSSADPGTIVSMSGTGASGGEIRVYFDDTVVTSVSGQQGAWILSFQVPYVSAGSHKITALDVPSMTKAIAMFTVTTSIVYVSWTPTVILCLIGAGMVSGMATLMVIASGLRRRKRVLE